MSKPYTHYAETAQSLNLKAAEWAKDKLKSLGINYPIHNSSLSDEENYERLRAYAEREACLVVEYLQKALSPAKQSETQTPNKTYKDWHDT